MPTLWCVTACAMRLLVRLGLLLVRDLARDMPGLVHPRGIDLD